MKSVGTSRIGLVRKLNEDRFYMEEPLFIVADGMGGHSGGEIASSIALDVMVNALKNKESIEEPQLAEAIIEANEAIRKRVEEEPTLKGMGTTAVIAYIKQHTLYWANVGDSRLYLYRGGELRQISSDHSMVQTLLDLGRITEEEARLHPQRNLLTRAVGVEVNLEVDTGILPLQLKDKLLLCSDGLSSIVEDEEICQILESKRTDKQRMDALISRVYDKGAKDNVTLIIVTI